MARDSRTKKCDLPPVPPLSVLLDNFLQALQVLNYSEHTVRNRRVHIGYFIRWCHTQGIREPDKITRPILEDYQRYLFHYRKKNGRPLASRSQLGTVGSSSDMVPMDGPGTTQFRTIRHPKWNCPGKSINCRGLSFLFPRSRRFSLTQM